jgi:hypothetical protein
MYQVYVGAQAQGSKSKEVLAITIQATDKLDFINFAPMFSKKDGNHILTVGEKYDALSFPPF